MYRHARLALRQELAQSFPALLYRGPCQALPILFHMGECTEEFAARVLDLEKSLSLSQV